MECTVQIKYLICYNRIFYEFMLAVLRSVFLYVAMVIVKLWRAGFKTVIVRSLYILKFDIEIISMLCQVKKVMGMSLFFVLFINTLWCINMTYRAFRSDDIISCVNNIIIQWMEVSSWPHLPRYRNSFLVIL